MTFRLGIDARTIEQGGGCATYVYELIPRIAALQPDWAIVVFFRSRGAVPQEWRAIPNIRICIMPIPKAALLVYDWVLMPLACVAMGIRLFHGPKSALSPLYRLLGIRTVVTIHDVIPLTHPETEKALNKVYWNVQIPLAYRVANAVITISQYSRKAIEELLGTRISRAARTHAAMDVIYHGYKRPQSEPAPWLELSTRFDIRQPYLLYVGTIQPRKNVSELIDAYVSSSLRDLHQLVIVGKKGWLVDALYERVQKEGLEQSVVFTGFVTEEELAALYMHAQVFAYISSIEGFGLPVLEAMSYGLPVLTANQSCLPEIGGNAVLAVDPKNVADVRNGLERLATDATLRDDMRTAGIARAQEFQWDTCAQQTVDVYLRTCPELSSAE